MLRLRMDQMVFPGGREKAFTLSFDDGISQDERLIRLMRERGMKGTFNLNTGLMGDQDWLSQPGIECSHYKFQTDQIRSVYQGFELAAHAHTHPDLASVAIPMAVYEVMENRKELEALLHRPVCGFAYPMGSYHEELEAALKLCGIRYARTTRSTGGFGLPEKFLEWHPSCHHTEERLFELAQVFLDNPAQKLSGGENSTVLTERPEKKRTMGMGLAKLFFVWGHTYELDAFQGWERMERFLDLMAGHDTVWYASSMEICDYVQSYRKLIYSASGDYIQNPTSHTVWMRADGILYQIPAGGVAEIQRPK